MKKSKILLKNFFDDQTRQLRVSSMDRTGLSGVKRLNGPTTEIVSRRSTKNSETVRSRVVRFEDGTVIKVTFELMEEGN